jgi:hypothetical protein
VIPGVEQCRAIAVHKSLVIKPPEDDATGCVALFRDLHAIPEILLVAGDLERLGGVRIQFPDLNAPPHPVISELSYMPSRRNRDGNEAVFRN